VARPALADIDALQPWSCTVDDLAAAHPQATHHDDGVQSRWTVIARASDSHDRRLTFAWGLLQRVSTTDD
jgi:hypothetical protein